MKKNLIIIPYEGFSEEDLYNFMNILDGKKYIATPDKEIAIGKFGSKVIPDFSIDDVFINDYKIYDRLIIIADKGYKILLKYPQIVPLFVRYKNFGKTIILSSLAQYAMAKLGLIFDMIITYNKKEFPKYYEKFLQYNLKVVDLPYVIDKGIITTRGRDDILSLRLDLKRIEEEIQNPLNIF